MNPPPPETLAVATVDGHRFDATLTAAGDSAAPLLVFLPALGTPARFYGRFAQAMAEAGVSVCVPDWRGIGSSSIRAARHQDFSYRHKVEVDVPALLAELHRRQPGTTPWIGGHSLGGQLAALVAAAHRKSVAGYVGIASGTVYIRCYPLRLRAGILALGALVTASRPLVGHFPGRRLGFGGREASGVMRDWLHTARSGRYELSGSVVDYEALLREFDRPALSLNFAADGWAPASIGRFLLEKMPNAPASHWVWHAAESGGHAFDHFSWAKQPQFVAPAVAAWMTAASAPSLGNEGTAPRP